MDEALSLRVAVANEAPAKCGVVALHSRAVVVVAASRATATIAVVDAITTLLGEAVVLVGRITTSRLGIVMHPLTSSQSGNF
jgi:hypothetical protein